MPELNHFPFGPDGEDSDVHRRVVGQCMRPRSATEIAYAFLRLDPNVPGELYHRTGVQPILDELEQAGLVKQVSAGDASALLDAQDADPDVINFDGDRKAFTDRAQHPFRFPFLEHGEPHYVRTKLGQEKLVGEAPPSTDQEGAVMRVGAPAAAFAQAERNGNE